MSDIKRTSGYEKASTGTGDVASPWVPTVGLAAGTSVSVTDVPATTSTVTSVAVQAASTGTTIRAAANALALNTTVCNNTGGDLYLLLGGSGNASASNFSEIVPNGQTWFAPPGTIYTGIIKGYSVSGGNVLMTEYTA